MTVSKLYEYMSDKVIPESVMPQNITTILRDDDSPVPELDAFTFLNRVRALGIGSADFLYLLKGCGAPESAVEKIENNPAMNLQSLVVTLEESGLTPRDYTRMLYTARQIWERTLTMRIEKVQTEDDEYEEELSEEELLDEQYDELPEEEYEELPEEEITDEVPEDSAVQVLPGEKDEELPEEDSAEDEPQSETEEAMSYDDVAAYVDEMYDEDDLPPSEDEQDYSNEQPEGTVAGATGYQRINEDDFYPKRHTGKIIAGFVGGAVLIGLCFAMDYFGFKPKDVPQLPKAHYAADTQELFLEVYNAYNDGMTGAGGVIPYCPDDSGLFGNMLFERSLSRCVTVGENAFSTSAEKLTVYSAEEDALVTLCTIEPPEGAEFVEFYIDKDRLYAVYAADDFAGFAAYDGKGSRLFGAEQKGILTDVCRGADSINLGTVYAIPFRESFAVGDTAEYMPLYSVNDVQAEVSAQDIITYGEASGSSYAVYGKYSMNDGAALEHSAAIGKAIYSDAECFMAVLDTADGVTLITQRSDDIAADEEQQSESELIVTKQLGAYAVDMCNTVHGIPAENSEPYSSVIEFEREQNVTVTAEKDENGADIVYIRGIDFEPLSAITNIPQQIKALRVCDAILYIYGESGVMMVVDISDAESPAPLEFTETQGVAGDGYALTTAVSDKVVELKLYSIDENGVVAAVGGCTRTVAPAEGKSVALCPDSTVFIGGETLSGAAYSYFDGVSVISEYAVFGKVNTAYTLFDDESGFTNAAVIKGKLHLIHAEGSVVVELP